MKLQQLILVAFILVNLSDSSLSQGFRTPRPSPNASVNQLLGVTDITIHYSRPGVKDRVIWGELVPYGKVWRTGANEVTSITFTDPLKINGNELAAGTYGIHTIPNENEWTIIFSKNTEVGGSSEYKPENDALQIKVKPQQAEFQERMLFTFSELTDNSAMVNLNWEKLKVSFKVEAEVQSIVLEKARQMVDWSTPMQAANYCLQNNINLDEGMKWIDVSTMINENYWNLRIKARLLEKKGNKQEAISTMEKAIGLGKAMENIPFDFDQFEKLLVEWKG